MNKRVRYKILLHLGLVLITLLPLAASAHVPDSTIIPAKTVRIGWFGNVFYQTDNLGHISGYAYDYQRRIAANTGWIYEYVYGSWPELFEKLERGEVDVLADVTPTHEREKKMLFSEYEMGKEDCYLVFKRNNTEIVSKDLQSLSGKRILVEKRSIAEQILRDWLKKMEVDAEVVSCFCSVEEAIRKLDAGEVDAWLANNEYYCLDRKNYAVFSYLGSSSIHFAINKNRPDLKEDIDRAMAEIALYSPSYNYDLRKRYFSVENIVYFFSNNELRWLDHHDHLVRIGYRDNYLPFCGTDQQTGEPTGLLRALADSINSKTDVVRVELVPYRTAAEAHQAVAEGEVDVAFPSSLSAFTSEEAHVFVTEPILNSGELAIRRKTFDFKPQEPLRVAVNDGNYDYVENLHHEFPHWKVVMYPTTEDGLRGIAKGEADVMLVNNYRVPVLIRRLENLGLNAFATGNTISLSFAVSEDDATLYSLINRLSKFLTPNEIQQSLGEYYQDNYRLSFGDFVRTHYLIVLIACLLIVGLFAVLLAHSMWEHRRAKKANEAKTRFLFNMSHDIRTPMNAIIGYTDLLMKNVDTADAAKQKDYLHKIQASSQMLLSLINNVLEMSRIEAGSMEIHETPHSPHDVREHVFMSFEEMMREKGLHFQVKELNSLSPAIYCDLPKVSEIYLNLISNAYKYTPAGGSVTVSTVEKPHPKPGYTLFETTVSDTGQGMSKEYLPRLFDEFTREHTSTEDKVVGSGLGMAIVKRLVTQMHGTITVESELGKGTTFVVTLPHRIADEKLLSKEEKNETAEIKLDGLHLLLAEDNDLNAEIAIEMLEDFGVKVTRAADGQECVDILRQSADGQFDAILMDVQMPRMNGYDATRVIRALTEKAKATIPIIAMTANAFEEDKKEALAAGMNAHIAKPVEGETLQKVLATLVKK